MSDVSMSDLSMSDVWGPLWLSMRIAAVATIVAGLVALPVARLMSRHRFLGKSVVECIMVVPMVLPPSVVGYLIIVWLGARGVIGHWLYQQFDYSIVFRFEGAALAAAIVALPMFYLPGKAAFASVPRELEECARLHGANRWQVLWHVTLPLARRGLNSGFVLAFARALGEFGATMMVFGWKPSRLTLPISVYADYETGDLAHARWAVAAMLVLSFGLIAAHNRSASSTQE
jgi:molybdate transport system permease protein